MIMNSKDLPCKINNSFMISFETNILRNIFKLKEKVPKKIYDALFLKVKFFKDFKTVFPLVYLNLNKMVPKNTKTILVFENDLFGIYQSLLGKRVTIVIQNSKERESYNSLIKKYDLNLELIDYKSILTKSKKYDLVYVNKELNSKDYVPLKNFSKNILTISSDQNLVYRFGNPEIYFPLGALSFKYSNLGLDVDPFFEDIYLIKVK